MFSPLLSVESVFASSFPEDFLSLLEVSSVLDSSVLPLVSLSEVALPDDSLESFPSDFPPSLDSPESVLPFSSLEGSVDESPDCFSSSVLLGLPSPSRLRVV